MELQGEKAIVTGGDGGFGEGIACALAERGAKVWITGRNREKLEAQPGKTRGCREKNGSGAGCSRCHFRGRLGPAFFACRR